MAEEQSQVAEVQSIDPSMQETSVSRVSASTEAPTSQSPDTSATTTTTTVPAATGEPAAPVAAEQQPPVHKEPPTKDPHAEKQRHSTQSDHHVKDRKSTHSHRHTFASRSTKDFRAFSRAGYMSMMSIKRGSLASFQDRQKQPKFMNTYKLHSEKPFNPDKVKSIIVKIVEENITDDMIYDQDLCPDKAKHISATIRQKVKEQEFDRYKLVCIVTIGEKKSHDMLTAVRFLWDSERDRYATHFYENMYLFAVASVFGLYYE